MLAKLFAVAAGCTFAVVSFDAGAVPASLFPLKQPSLVTLIAGGCGPGWHRGPYGGCRRNWGSSAAAAGSGPRPTGRAASVAGDSG
jgi:hypothetical protein